MFTGLLKMLHFPHLTRESVPSPVQQLEQDTRSNEETEDTVDQPTTAVTEYRVEDDVRLGDAWKKICNICRTHASTGGSGLRVKWISVGIDPSASAPEDVSRNQTIADYLVAHMRECGLYVRNYYGNPSDRDFHVSWKRH